MTYSFQSSVFYYPCCQQTPCLAQAPTQPHYSYQSLTRRSRWNNMACHNHHIDVLKYIQFFFDSLVILRHFTGNRKVSCLIAVFSYRTKQELPAGEHYWKFSRQCSIFGRIGDQWVAISSPDLWPNYGGDCLQMTDQPKHLMMKMMMTLFKLGWNKAC